MKCAHFERGALAWGSRCSSSVRLHVLPPPSLYVSASCDSLEVHFLGLCSSSHFQFAPSVAETLTPLYSWTVVLASSQVRSTSPRWPSWLWVVKIWPREVVGKSLLEQSPPSLISQACWAVGV